MLSCCCWRAGMISHLETGQHVQPYYLNCCIFQLNKKNKRACLFCCSLSSHRFALYPLLIAVTEVMWEWKQRCCCCCCGRWCLWNLLFLEIENMKKNIEVKSRLCNVDVIMAIETSNPKNILNAYKQIKQNSNAARTTEMLSCLKGDIQCPFYHKLIWFLGVLMKCL